MGRKFLFISWVVFSLSACLNLTMQNTFADLAPGQWRAVFSLENEKVPVQFSVENIDEATHFTFLNGGLDTQSDQVDFWGDTLTIPFNQGTYLKVIYEVDKMEGYLYDPNNSFYPISFLAQQGQLNRFPDVRKDPVMNMTGNWNASLGTKDTTISTQLILEAEGNNVVGEVFWNADTLSLCGVIQDDILVLSGFNGKQVCYLNGQVLEGAISKALLIVNDEKFTLTAVKDINE